MYLGEIKKTILFTIAAKRIKYLGMHSTEEVKDLYKTLKEEIFSFFGCAGSSRWLVGFSSCGLQSASAQKLQVEGLVAPGMWNLSSLMRDPVCIPCN